MFYLWKRGGLGKNALMLCDYVRASWFGSRSGALSLTLYALLKLMEWWKNTCEQCPTRILLLVMTVGKMLKKRGCC